VSGGYGDSRGDALATVDAAVAPCDSLSFRRFDCEGAQTRRKGGGVDTKQLDSFSAINASIGTLERPHQGGTFAGSTFAALAPSMRIRMRILDAMCPYERPRGSRPPLSAVSSALVGDVAYVVRIETLRSAPVIVWPAKAIPAVDRTLRPRLIASSPAERL
jgi:hypothetical protein